MNDKFQYRLSEKQKVEIAQNLIDILEKNSEITDQTVGFIGNWILTGPDEKSKAFFDVWDIVLRNYLPTTRPILFRTCNRLGKDGKIASFTGRLECARSFSKGKGFLIICFNVKRNIFSLVSICIHFIPLSMSWKKRVPPVGGDFQKRF